MCCRYYIEPQDTLLAQLGDVAEHTELRKRMLEPIAKPLRTCGEIRPGGFNSRNRALLPNARSETAGQKPLFQGAWNAHRCIIPASWYYEWEHFLRPNGKKETGDKYLLQPKGDSRTWLCGLYRFEEGFPHFVVLTRPPSEEVSFIHDRMPLMLREKDVDEWISPDAKPDEIAYRAVTDLHFEKTDNTDKRPEPHMFVKLP